MAGAWGSQAEVTGKAPDLEHTTGSVASLASPVTGFLRTQVMRRSSKQPWNVARVGFCKRRISDQIPVLWNGKLAASCYKMYQHFIYFEYKCG